MLAYAGASLPLLLFFAQGTVPAVRVMTGELVAMEIVRMLVGSIVAATRHDETARQLCRPDPLICN